MRPTTLDDYIGQEHVVGKDAVLRRMIESGHISSFILWGPPGVGKTTLAQIIAGKIKEPRRATLKAIARVLGCSERWLAEGEGKGPTVRRM